MDWVRLLELLRYPLETIAFVVALTPALMVLQSWTALPILIPTHFTAGGHPDRWGSRMRAWVLPLVAVMVYAVMCRATGTWAWVNDSKAGIPSGAEILLFLKPGFGLLMMQATAVLIRVAKGEAESLNGWLLWGLMLLLVTPPLALSMAVR